MQKQVRFGKDSNTSAKSFGRSEEGKINSGRGRGQSLLEQVAFKLGLEGWVGFQQADVGNGGGGAAQARKMQKKGNRAQAECRVLVHRHNGSIEEM